MSHYCYQCSPSLFPLTWCLCWCSDVAMAMEVTSSGTQTLQKAQGDAVILGCTYTPGPMDTGDLDIEWSVISPDTTQKDQLVSTTQLFCFLFFTFSILFLDRKFKNRKWMGARWVVGLLPDLNLSVEQWAMNLHEKWGHWVIVGTAPICGMGH